jgi:hypothetical protein
MMTCRIPVPSYVTYETRYFRLSCVAAVVMLAARESGHPAAIQPVLGMVRARRCLVRIAYGNG